MRYQCQTSQPAFKERLAFRIDTYPANRRINVVGVLCHRQVILEGISLGHIRRIHQSRIAGQPTRFQQVNRIALFEGDTGSDRLHGNRRPCQIRSLRCLDHDRIVGCGRGQIKIIVFEIADFPDVDARSRYIQGIAGPDIRSRRNRAGRPGLDKSPVNRCIRAERGIAGNTDRIPGRFCGRAGIKLSIAQDKTAIHVTVYRGVRNGNRIVTGCNGNGSRAESLARCISTENTAVYRGTRGNRDTVIAGVDDHIATTRVVSFSRTAINASANGSIGSDKHLIVFRAEIDQSSSLT